MTAVTQQIPNFILGESEQPDELKLPGQVRSLSNGIPDVTEGLKKRPGSKFMMKKYILIQVLLNGLIFTMMRIINILVVLIQTV